MKLTGSQIVDLLHAGLENGRAIQAIAIAEEWIKSAEELLAENDDGLTERQRRLVAISHDHCNRCTSQPECESVDNGHQTWEGECPFVFKDWVLKKWNNPHPPTQRKED